MTSITQILVDRNDFRRTEIAETPAPALQDGQILVEVEQFGLTANNVTYAVTGDMIGYWGFFPAEAPWGKVPVWGFARVVDSKSPDIRLGERIYGYFPMASHVVLDVGRAKPQRFTDVAEHRQSLPALYNSYTRCDADPEILSGLDDARCLYFPLFATSYVLYDYFIDNDGFGAEQILIGSASSKTGFGLAFLLHRDPAVKQKVIGLTSPGNIEFVEKLDICERVVAYGDVDSAFEPATPTAFVDMSGDGPLTEKLHMLFQDNLVESCKVGATHWETARTTEADLPGAKPKLFFAPAQIGKRNDEWGPGVMMDRAYKASADISKAIKDDITVRRLQGAEATATAWRDTLDNKIPPSTGLIVTI
ncbi:MAG: DUF2855 family protein [Pseudomonadota bacterium]